MLAALAARTRGLDTVLVCYGDPVPPVGNMHLATTIGADIRFTGDEDRASVDSGVAAVADELRAAGRTPYPMGRGGATARRRARLPHRGPGAGRPARRRRVRADRHLAGHRLVRHPGRVSWRARRGSGWARWSA